jgi:hypothetical protein
MRLATEVTNISTGKRYFVSTAEVQAIGNRVWQTAVFRKRFGPLAGMFRPALFIGGVAEGTARLQHEQVQAIVRDTPPREWELAKWQLLSKLVDSQTESQAAGDRDFFEKLLRMTGGELELDGEGR